MFPVIIGILLRSLKCQTSDIKATIIVRLLRINVIWFVLYLYYFVTWTLILFWDFIFAIIIMIVSLEFFFSFRSQYNNYHMRVHVLHSDFMRKTIFFSRSRIVIHFCFSFTCLFFMAVGFVSLCMPWIHAIHAMTWYTCDT